MDDQVIKILQRIKDRDVETLRQVRDLTDELDLLYKATDDLWIWRRVSVWLIVFGNAYVPLVVPVSGAYSAWTLSIFSGAYLCITWVRYRYNEKIKHNLDMQSMLLENFRS